MKADQDRKMLQSEIICVGKQQDASLARIDLLEKENQELRQEIARLKAQINSLKAHDNERKSMLWKKLHNSIDSSTTSDFFKAGEKNLELEPFKPRSIFQELAARKEKPAARLLRPPPKPPSALHTNLKGVNGNTNTGPSAPPPPPPLPSKSLLGSRSVRRFPEIFVLYRLLTKKEAHMENRTISASVPVVTFTKTMIGEIENRSSYLSAIKSDVEKQKEFINFLIKEVESAAFTDISNVETFVKWLDEELSSLTDERQVLKHFPQWPERKADTLREAAFTYRDLRSLESEVTSFKDNPKEYPKQALRKIQSLQDRLEQSVGNVERTRESTSKRYRDYQIPFDWMLNSGLIGQMKLSSLRLAKESMKRVTKELQLNGSFKEDFENLLLQGVRFAYRIHQFAGGFDAETIRIFEELKKIALVDIKQ